MTPPDRASPLLLAVIALAVLWIAMRPHAGPPAAEASRQALSVNVERVGGRLLWDGAIPVRCVK
jgi:hypothetical protein